MAVSSASFRVVSFLCLIFAALMTVASSQVAAPAPAPTSDGNSSFLLVCLVSRLKCDIKNNFNILNVVFILLKRVSKFKHVILFFLFILDFIVGACLIPFMLFPPSILACNTD